MGGLASTWCAGANAIWGPTAVALHRRSFRLTQKGLFGLNGDSCTRNVLRNRRLLANLLYPPFPWVPQSVFRTRAHAGATWAILRHIDAFYACTISSLALVLGRTEFYISLNKIGSWFLSEKMTCPPPYSGGARGVGHHLCAAQRTGTIKRAVSARRDRARCEKLSIFYVRTLYEISRDLARSIFREITQAWPCED